MAGDAAGATVSVASVGGSELGEAVGPGDGANVGPKVVGLEVAGLKVVGAAEGDAVGLLALGLVVGVPDVGDTAGAAVGAVDAAVGAMVFTK